MQSGDIFSQIRTVNWYDRSMIMLKIADLERFVLLLGRLHVLFSVSLFPYCF
jgi:hypothetical protein